MPERPARCFAPVPGRARAVEAENMVAGKFPPPLTDWAKVAPTFLPGGTDLFGAVPSSVFASSASRMLLSIMRERRCRAGDKGARGGASKRLLKGQLLLLNILQKSKTANPPERVDG